jgi:hypothetical protein
MGNLSQVMGFLPVTDNVVLDAAMHNGRVGMAAMLAAQVGLST